MATKNLILRSINFLRYNQYGNLLSVIIIMTICVVLLYHDFNEDQVLSLKSNRRRKYVYATHYSMYSNINNSNCQAVQFDCDNQFTTEWFPIGVLTGDNITGWPVKIVPNIVHYIVFDKFELTFVHFISLLSVLYNQNPDQVIIHCNCQQIFGNYWDVLLEEFSIRNRILKIKEVEKPLTVWEHKLNNGWNEQHAYDVLRLRILMENGGIFLDKDVLICQSLDQFLNFEMTIDWDERHGIGNQVIIANKKARFLNLWYKSYEEYKNSSLKYNSQELPTQAILNFYPHFVHRVKQKFGANAHIMVPYLYQQNNYDWEKNYFAIKLFMEDKTVVNWAFKSGKEEKPPSFDLEDIPSLESTFGQIVRKIVYGSSNISSNNDEK